MTRDNARQLAETDPGAAITAAWQAFRQANWDTQDRLGVNTYRGGLHSNVDDVERMAIAQQIPVSLIEVAEQLFQGYSEYHGDETDTATALQYVSSAEQLIAALQQIN
ncbi:hypothetical protein ACSMXN_09195 [Jatrophihabitans sp. DSM 45814]